MSIDGNFIFQCHKTTNLCINTRLDLVSLAAPSFSPSLGNSSSAVSGNPIVLEVWKVQLHTFISGKLVFGRPLSGRLWSAVRSDYWGQNCEGHHMYNGDLLNPDRPAVWLQLQEASLSAETSIHLVHQGRKPTSHLAVWVICTTCH